MPHPHLASLRLRHIVTVPFIVIGPQSDLCICFFGLLVEVLNKILICHMSLCSQLLTTAMNDRRVLVCHASDKDFELNVYYVRRISVEIYENRRLVPVADITLNAHGCHGSIGAKSRRKAGYMPPPSFDSEKKEKYLISSACTGFGAAGSKDPFCYSMTLPRVLGMRKGRCRHSKGMLSGTVSWRGSCGADRN